MSAGPGLDSGGGGTEEETTDDGGSDFDPSDHLDDGSEETESPDSGGETTGPGPSGGPSTSSGDPTQTTAQPPPGSQETDPSPSPGRPDDSRPRDIRARAESELERRTGLDLTEDDFRVRETDDGVRAGLTPRGQSRLADLRARERRERRTARGQRLEVGESSVGFDVFFRGVALRESQEESRSQADASSIDVGQVERIAEDREAVERAERQIEERIERDIERQIGSARAEASGITGSRLREALVESTDLERGRDFQIRREATADGVRISGGLTDEFRQSFAEDIVETRLERATGVDLEPGRDFNVLVDEETGEVTPVLTDVGRGRIATADADRTVRDLERGQIPVFTDVTGVRGPRFDVPGEGPIAPEPRSTDALSSDVEALEEGQGAIESRADEARERLREGEGTFRSPLTGERPLGAETLDPVAGGLLAGGVTIGEVASTLPIRTADVILAGRDAVASDVEAGLGTEEATASAEFTDQVGTAAGRLPVTAASGLIREARESPLRLAGAVGGSLGVSAAAMRLLPASRFAIQPGEELAGSAGFRATRRVAGERRAQQLFPNREPLIFSEEAVIARARGLRDRLAGDVEVETERPRTDLPDERPQLLTSEAVDEAMGVSGPSRLSLARGRARRGLESFRERVDVRTRVGAGPFGAVEVEIEPEVETEPEPDFRDFDPSRGEVLGGGASEVAREEMVERQREARRMLGGEFESEVDPIRGAETRLEVAQRAEVGTEAAAIEAEIARTEIALSTDLASPALTLELVEARSRQRERQRVLEDVDLDTGLETREDTEQEFETELEPREVETEVGLEVEAETETEAELALETEAETEVRVEAETDEDDDFRPRDPGLEPADLGIGRTTEADLLPGFVSETVADIALTGGRSGRAPPQDVLAGLVESGAAPAEELPTFEEILGTPEEREAIEETREFFGLGRDLEL